MKLTQRQQQVYDALPTIDFESSGIIARKAGIRTISPAETAAKFCNQLAGLGLAEKGGTRTFPKWRAMPRRMTEEELLAGLQDLITPPVI